MKWLQRWFDRRLENSWNRAHERRNVIAPSNEIQLREDPFNFKDGLRIEIKNATGGKVVQIGIYDKKQHEHRYATYIITDEQDFTQELAKAITAESLKAL
jgi:hypothetical protein